jgi:hypothetical protein
MSDLRLGIVERAYEIARSGRARSLEQITSILKQEGYTNVPQQLGSAPLLRKALRDLCASAQRQDS